MSETEGTTPAPSRATPKFAQLVSGLRDRVHRIEGGITVGPILVVTNRAHSDELRNAFYLGRDYGRLVSEDRELQQMGGRHLRLVR